MFVPSLSWQNEDAFYIKSGQKVPFFAPMPSSSARLISESWAAQESARCRDCGRLCSSTSSCVRFLPAKHAPLVEFSLSYVCPEPVSVK